MTAARSCAAAIAAALLLAACGSDDDGAVDTGTEPITATAPVSPPEETFTEPPVTVTAPAPAPSDPEEAPGGAGDEDGIRVPARFVLQANGALTPDSAEVPAFLNVEVIVDNRDDVAHRLEVGDRATRLPAGRTTTLSLPGRAATELPVLIDGDPAAVLDIVAETVP